VRDDRFEWDDAKADANRRKHGISFDVACEAFNDPFGFDEVDHDPDEVRWIRTGMSKSGILVVINTERGHRIRIISARRANRHEQDDYHRQAHS
jgi:uncharacterized protein